MSLFSTIDILSGLSGLDHPHSCGLNDPFSATYGAGFDPQSDGRLASDHQYITFEVVDKNSRCATPRRSFCAWNAVKVNTGRLVKILDTDGVALEGTPGGGGAAVDTVRDSVMNLIETWQTFYSATKFRKGWHRFRRLTQCLIDWEDACTVMAEYKSAKRRLRSEINKSKFRCWEDLVDGMNRLQTGNPKNRWSAETLFT